MKDKSVIENANKITYLLQQYPEKTFADIMGMLNIAPIDSNVAIWTAEELGWIKRVGEGDDRHPELATPPAPNEWVFGAAVKELEEKILYALGKVAETEADLHDYFYSQWMGNYAQDAFVATKHLIEQKKIAEYMIEDGVNEYVFYTLYKNRDKLWGRKQFKKDPLDPNAGEDESDEAQTEE